MYLINNKNFNIININNINVSDLNFFFLYKNLNFYNSSSYFFKNKISYIRNKQDFRENQLIFDKNINVFKKFKNFKKNSFIFFFIENLIDVPKIFKNFKSLNFKSFELYDLRFLNMLMRGGKKEQIFRIFWKSFLLFFNFFKNQLIKKYCENLILFYYLNNLFFDFSNFKLYNTFFDLDNKLIFNHELSTKGKHINYSFFFKNFFKNFFLKINPIFAYFIYKVDKNVRKYSRGKSGKYTFFWKYVPFYKRKFVTARWVVKDIKFYQSNKFSNRINGVLNELMFNEKETFPYKSKKYTYFYIFKNFRKTLMTNLKTINK